MIGKLIKIDFERDRPFGSIFHGICKKVHNALPDPDLIAEKNAGNVFIHLQMKGESLLCRAVPYHVGKVVDEGRELVLDGYYLKLSFFDL